MIRSYRGSHLKANSIVNWFVALFEELGFEGCSSHSGRRSFITIAARNVHRSGCSLRDVQLLAGIVRSKRRSATSTATPAHRGDWLRTFRDRSRRGRHVYRAALVAKQIAHRIGLSSGTLYR